ncbi:HD domain-containing phosphohydrolase [Alkalimarinus coralli]|uniref:HD domain-containing phosphohydrolase n=1 Tax=Alkalimarinus coralli TaxID=2935863 RepID=UPI00202B5A57|nr:HD domain-containing phosphohydrolase [Alkalimarinus coralli]
MNSGDEPQSKTYSFPIRIHLFVAIVSFVLLLGISLGVFHYQKITKLIIEDAEAVFDRAAQDVFLKFETTYHPVATTVDLLSFSNLLQADSFEQRIVYLEQLANVLKTKPELVNLVVGNANSEALILRRIENNDERNLYAAPVNTAYVIDNIETDSGGAILSRYFYDHSLVQIAHKSLEQTTYDPLKRLWYEQALAHDAIITTKPYLFYFSGIVGITVAKHNTNKNAVIAADISLKNLSQTLRLSQVTPGSRLYLIDKENRLLASSEDDNFILSSTLDKTERKSIKELNNPLLNQIVHREGTYYEKGSFFEVKGDEWLAAARNVDLSDDLNLRLLILVPKEELLIEALVVRDQSILITIIIIILSIPAALFIATKISNPLKMLAEQTSRVRRFDFTKPVKVDSFILEISDLGNSIQLMQDTIHNFIEMINSVAGEKDFDRLLEKITRDTIEVSSASGAVVYLLNEDETRLQPSCFMTPSGVVDSLLNDVDITQESLFSTSINSQQTITFTVDRLIGEASDKASQGGVFQVLDALAVDELKVVVFPLKNRQFEHIGMLCLLFDPLTKGEAAQSAEKLDFVQAVTGFSALTIESAQMVETRKNLLEAFIKLIAGAIDEKSPYTGGHCQRVPVLTNMLAEAACKSDDARFSDFDLKKEQWEELHIASWLHDCGKVTTPEYVIDKSTKLETLYDRIHEVRMRFEVIKRETELEFWKSVANGANKEELKPGLDKALAELDDDFAFIAECNLGAEFMAPEALTRLNKIAQRKWLRTLDDRLGISWEEQQRKAKIPAPALPVVEPLLADRADHIIERDPGVYDDPDNPWGFKLQIPEHKFNKGELYNLSVARGTLTEEERFIINNHMTQTIIMLSKLPFPKQMKAIPEIAGGHHEKMDGTGYPKRLRREDMPLSARMMAIADIFEALTASDRPYKKAKTLSQAIEIMGHMKKDNHIDPDLFELFLTSGVYKQYGRQYLEPEQVDDVDISPYIG